ncbi:MAG: DUF421 domain-containing protein [Oscillospiraceae bacterium]
MQILKVLFTSAFSIIAIFLLTRLMGKRQISQLNMFDYVNGITIGSIAAEMATSLENDFWLPLTAMLVYTSFSLAIAFLERKSLKLNKFFTGNPYILFDKGILYKQNLIKAKISITEFLSQCRANGFFNLDEIETAILEPNGSISILPKSDYRPATPLDLKLKPKNAEIVPIVIVDGNILTTNLESLGFNQIWLIEELLRQKVSSPADVFLATCTSEGKLCVYVKVKNEDKYEPFI